MTVRPFASSADLAEKGATVERLADGVHAYRAQGDPNVGCIVGTESALAIAAGRRRRALARQTSYWS
jgi:hypothetical protein